MPFCGNACAFPPRPLRWRKPVVLSAECIIFAFPNLTNPATDVRVRFIRFLCLVALVSLCACRVTKFVPDGSYLLDKVTIETKGREVKKDELQKYVRQAPNSSVFGIWRMQLRLYSLAGRDTARWHNRLLMRMGEAPVIYDETQTYLSEQSLRQALANRGYMHAEVGSSVELADKRAHVTYHVRENEPYRLRRYDVHVPDSALAAVAADSARSLLREGMLFDADVFNAERERISSRLRQQGYYHFSKELLAYEADSAVGGNRVDVSMHMSPLVPMDNDSLRRAVFSRYHVRRVVFFTSRGIRGGSGNHFSNNPDDFNLERSGGYTLISEKEEFLRLKTLVENTFVQPGDLYTDAAVERTYAALNALSPVKYVNISFQEVAGDSLDCLINVAPAKLFSLTAEMEATYTDGFWGVAANLGTVHRNVFHGAESLSLQGRLAYEWQGEGVLANELGLQAGLQFPSLLAPLVSDQFRRNARATTQFTADISSQNRPGEFNVKRFGVGMNYNWTRGRLRHTFDPLDINYVNFNVEDEFRREFLETNRFNPYSYESHFITRIGYTGSFSTFNPNQPLRNHLSLRYSLETAGNVLYGISHLFNTKKNDEGFYTVVGDIPYSQYVRGDVNFTFHQIFDGNNRFVYHFFAGAGVPYGNGSVIPYERRYYSGGANSVRGWAESTLGPGVYQRDRSIRRGRDYNQIGDVKLDLNFEYRYKMFGKLDGALFVDAGNIWTIRPYETQPGGEFRFDTFWRQLGLSYGLGFRLDFSFLVVRLDLGVKLHDPSRPEGDRWRTKLTSDDFALHFAIGYPF